MSAGHFVIDTHCAVLPRGKHHSFRLDALVDKYERRPLTHDEAHRAAAAISRCRGVVKVVVTHVVETSHAVYAGRSDRLKKQGE